MFYKGLLYFDCKKCSPFFSYTVLWWHLICLNHCLTRTLFWYQEWGRYSVNFFCVCGKIHITELAISTIFKCTIDYIYSVVQPSQLFSKLSAPQTETLYPLSNNSLLCLPPAPSNLYSTFCLYSFVDSRYLLQVES